MTRDTEPDRSEIPEETREELSETELRQRIQAKARELYVLRGGVQGQDWDDWFEAERIVRKQTTRRRKANG
ncbi:MAG: DUF2934 domain-containing protein [bacterium]